MLEDELNGIIDAALDRIFSGTLSPQIFAAFLTAHKIQILDISHRGLKLEQLERLLPVLPLSPIRTLNVSDNFIESLGVEKLMAVLPHTKVVHLDISKNILEDAGAKCIANALPLTKLETLIVWGSGISEEGVLALQIAAKNKMAPGFQKAVTFTEPVNTSQMKHGHPRKRFN